MLRRFAPGKGMTKFERMLVWAGGAAFVLSLAFAGWWYFVRLGVAAPFAGPDAVAVNGLLFTAFALHHSLLARPAVKRAMASLVPERWLRSVYVWTASILLVMVCLLWRRVGAIVYRVPFPWVMLNAAVQLAGIALIAQAVRAIDPLELAGIRHGGDHQQLQITGPYHLVRHPLYLGWVLLLFGTAQMTGDRLAFAAISSLYLFVAVPWEERSLEREFGEIYRRYKEAVRWRIIPYLY
jgi:protein-S-isoprenylcysteine O-methyltransferase Ste14